MDMERDRDSQVIELSTIIDADIKYKLPIYLYEYNQLYQL